MYLYLYAWKRIDISRSGKESIRQDAPDEEKTTGVPKVNMEVQNLESDEV
jgi:hypothetical protein